MLIITKLIIRVLSMNSNEIKSNSFEFDIENSNDTNIITSIGRALSSPIRIAILCELNKKPMLLSEIAEKFNLPISSTAFHMSALEDANLVSIEYSTKGKGTLKWFTYTKREIKIALRPEIKSKKKTPIVSYKIGVGEYIDAVFSNNCGITTETEVIMENVSNNVFTPKRFNAQLVWFKHSGYVTYAIPNSYYEENNISEINFSVEICSEAKGFNEEYPSDITFWINNIEICTYTSPGDFGERYGKFTPSWWYPESTKYGLLVNITVKENGVYLNEQLVNKNININNLNLGQDNRNTIKIGVKENAVHKGGLNIFGEKFGDYNQAIIFTARYK